MPATNELLQEGRYRIQTSSQSGDEKVFEAYDTVRNTNVVVREIPVKLNKVSTVSQRESLHLEFANQAKALTEIEHESLVHVQDYFSEIDRQYLVTEAVQGESLVDLLAKNQKPFSVNEVTAWADELLDALNYLHARKPPIIHRNINPSNLKVDSAGKIKLIGVGVDSTDSDFAGSYHAEGDLRYSPLEHIWPGLDPASQKAITNHYDDRSERILKQPLDERSDIYSLGATLYYLVTGVEPVDPIERSIEILEGKLDPLREPTNMDAQIPAEISDVLMKALEIKRENRYDAAVIMRQVLKTALARVRERVDGAGTESTDAVDVSPAVAPKVDVEAELAEQQRLEAEAEHQRREAEAEQQRREVEADQQRREAESEQRREAEAEQQRREAEAEQQRQTEQEALMDLQLREAEEERVRAERAAAEAAEAEMLRVEKETVENSVAAGTDSILRDDNLVDVPVEPSAEVVAYRETAEVDEDELAAVLSQLEEAEEEDAVGSGTEDAAETAGVAVYDSPIDLAPQPEAAPDVDPDIDDIFTIPGKTGSSLPVPALAAGLVLVGAIAVGGWFVMSGSGDTTKPESVPTVQSAQPAPAQPAPTADPATIASGQSGPEDGTQPSEGTTDQQPAALSKTGTAARPRKAEPAKAQSAKKKVTVDDLINDN